ARLGTVESGRVAPIGMQERIGPARNADLNPIALVRRSEIQLRPRRYDAGGVDLGMATIVMAFVVPKVHRGGHTRVLVDLSRVSPQCRKINNTLVVTLEMADRKS